MQQHSDNPPRNAPPAEMQFGASWGVCLSFWCCLLAAAALYGSVALAPKLSRWIQVRHQYATNAAHIARLDAHVEYLERVAHTLETDPDFSRRLAAASDLSGTGSDVIPVSKGLLFGNDGQAVPEKQNVPFPAGTPLVRRLATDRSLRLTLLGSAVVLVIFGFTFLNDSDTSWLRRFPAALGKLGRSAVRRYLQPEELNSAASQDSNAPRAQEDAESRQSVPETPPRTSEQRDSERDLPDEVPSE